MSITIYNVMGQGFVVGQKIEKDDTFIYLKYPGLFLPQQRTQQGPRDAMAEPLPNILAGRDEMLNRFPVKKSLIVYSGRPNGPIMDLYQQYERNIRARISGLKLVSADATNHLPRNAKGEPIIQ